MLGHTASVVHYSGERASVLRSQTDRADYGGFQ